MIDCRKCKEYFVTWDRAAPHGCRAMLFKSRELPSIIVYKNSGSPCLLFVPKVATPGEADPRRKTGQEGTDES